MGRQKLTTPHQESCTTARPKRKATNAHIFRYLQTRNPSKLEENDLRRALEVSLEECPDFWPEDTASCSSSDQSNATSASCSSSTGGNSDKRKTLQRLGNTRKNKSTDKRKSKSSTMQHNHLCNSNHHSHHTNNHSMNHHHPTNSYANCTANHHQCKCCPSSSVHNRYKPVAKKNIYNEADFFHDGIMEYIKFELMEKDIIQMKKTKSD